MTTRSRRSRVVAVIGAVALMMMSSLSGLARQDSRTPQIGRIDFMAVTKDGQPVGDLKIEEVVLRIDGKIRPLKSLVYQKISDGLSAAAMAATAAAGGPGGPAAGAGASADIAPAFATNVVPTISLSRHIVLMVDDETMPIGQEQTLRATLTRFVRSLPEADQVTLITVPRGGVIVAQTSDRERLSKGIATLAPYSSIDDPACRSRSMLSVLETTMNRLLSQRANDQPIVVALLSASITGVSNQEQAQRADISGRGGVSAQAGACPLRAEDFEKVGRAVAGAHAQFYVIHPDYSPNPAADGIENLRSRTGAPLYHLTSSGEPGLNRMARETAGYYLATYDTETDELTGKPHLSKITTTRQTVEVRDRPYVIVGKELGAPGSARPDPGLGAVTTAYDMVRSGRPFRDLPLRATSTQSRNSKTPEAIDVIGFFEPLDPNSKIMQAAAALFDENGVAQAYWQNEPKQPLSTWPTAIGLTVKPGTYKMRIAAIDANGRTGLIEDTVVAQLQKAGPLQMGGLMLGVSRASGFTPRMAFSAEASAIAMVELYGTLAPDAQVSVVFEVSKTTDGLSMFNVNATAAPSNEDGKYIVMGTIPVGALSAGDYVIRAVLTVQGQGSGRVIRTLRKG